MNDTNNNENEFMNFNDFSMTSEKMMEYYRKEMISQITKNQTLYDELSKLKVELANKDALIEELTKKLDFIKRFILSNNQQTAQESDIFQQNSESPEQLQVNDSSTTTTFERRQRASNDSSAGIYSLKDEPIAPPAAQFDNESIHTIELSDDDSDDGRFNLRLDLSDNENKNRQNELNQPIKRADIRIRFLRGDYNIQVINIKELQTSKKLMCPCCTTSFTYRNLIVDHFRRTHLSKEVKSPIIRYRCHICDNIYYNLEELSSHLSVHQNEAFKCLRCHALFRNKQSCTLHLKRASCV